jgi:threonine aldolase
LWGAQPKALAGDARGILDPAQVEAAIRPDASQFEQSDDLIARAACRVMDHYPRSRVLALENTHNHGGGTVYPLARVRELEELASRYRLAVYLDGARLFNASVASGVSVRDYAAGASLVSVCLSKGLGAPAGSVVCGSRELVAKARRLRKRLGGAMRQSGILAAAGLYALEHNVERLAEDHEAARRLAEGLGSLRGVRIPHEIQTNIVFASFEGQNAQELCMRLFQLGVLAYPEGTVPDRVRFVTHMDVPAPAIDEAVRRIGQLLSSGGGRA